MEGRPAARYRKIRGDWETGVRRYPKFDARPVQEEILGAVNPRKPTLPMIGQEDVVWFQGQPPSSNTVFQVHLLVTRPTLWPGRQLRSSHPHVHSPLRSINKCVDSRTEEPPTSRCEGDGTTHHASSSTWKYAREGIAPLHEQLATSQNPPVNLGSLPPSI